jgi:hypothetical protein
VPWLGLAADNPPLAAGAFYCVLDLLVVTTTKRYQVSFLKGGKTNLVPFRSD